MEIGICFEPLEPRLLLSGSWVTGVEASSADSQSATESGFGAVTATISDGPETIGLDALSQNQHALGAGTFVDVLADAPILNSFDFNNGNNSAHTISKTSLTTDATAATTGNVLATPINDSTENILNSFAQGDFIDVNELSELIFINENVEGYEQLIAGLKGDDNRSYEVVILDADRDGIARLAKFLPNDQTFQRYILSPTAPTGRLI